MRWLLKRKFKLFREQTDFTLIEILFAVVPKTPVPTIFSDPPLSVTYEDFNTGYSWNTGAVIVPAYDSRTEAGQVE